MALKQWLRWSLLALWLAIPGLATEAAENQLKSEEQVTVIGLDSMGRAVGIDIPESKYNESLKAGMTAVTASLSPLLNAKNNGARPKQTWNLRTIGVGIGLSGQFGLGPLVHVTLSPRLRLIFSNRGAAIFPD